MPYTGENKYQQQYKQANIDNIMRMVELEEQYNKMVSNGSSREELDAFFKDYIKPNCLYKEGDIVSVTTPTKNLYWPSKFIDIVICYERGRYNITCITKRGFVRRDENKVRYLEVDIDVNLKHVDKVRYDSITKMKNKVEYIKYFTKRIYSGPKRGMIDRPE